MFRNSAVAGLMFSAMHFGRHKWRPWGIAAAINGGPAGNSGPIVENRHKKSGPESAFLLQSLPYA
ncbi:hypothetical protein DSL62_03210 [Pantoea sp. 3_1284]|nr:hypothetical protein HA43_13155 [Pantoea eucrina]RBO15458.1 hypothetical protein DSL62_03210 [Pantoea sp. 3_1284]